MPYRTPFLGFVPYLVFEYVLSATTVNSTLSVSPVRVRVSPNAADTSLGGGGLYAAAGVVAVKTDVQEGDAAAVFGASAEVRVARTATAPARTTTSAARPP